MAFHLLRLAALGTAALALAHWRAPATFWINAFWLALLLVMAFLAGTAYVRLGLAVRLGEAVVLMVAAQALWSTAFPDSARPRPVVGERSGAAWVVAFSDVQHAIGKTLPRPVGWDVDATYLRVDLGGPYRGDGGLHVMANGRYVGVLNARTSAESAHFPGVPAWSIKVPVDALALSELVRVELRPAKVDTHLLVAGHADPLVDALVPGSSRFYDGTRWRADRLAGFGTQQVNGTYRIWLLRSWGEGL